MLIKKAADLRESDVTSQDLYLRRREFIRGTGTAIMAAAAGAALGTPAFAEPAAAQNPNAYKFPDLKKGPFATDEKMNSYKDATTYNNFYEFGLDKGDPSHYAGTLKTRPWSVVVEGLCGKPGTYNIEDIVKWFPLEERIYRMRCVEAWSMVIPWVGFPLADFVKRFEPTCEGEVRRVQDAARHEADARTDRTGAAVALHRRSAHGRSDASARDPGGRPLR